MAAVAKVFARIFSSDPNKLDVPKQIAMLSLAALFVWILTMTYGVDLSPGLF
jgi:ribose/xylose/arabinose/galactoside ABC-type transport system permease subunit